MVCSCKDRCNCEEHCTCCGRCCTCLVCHRIKVCNCDRLPVCEAAVANTKSDTKFCQCLQSEVEETPTYSATTAAENVSIVTSGEKPKECKSSKNATTLPKTPYESTTFNDRTMLISDNGQLSKLSVQKTSNASRFGSLKLTFQKIKSRFKNFKNRKSDRSPLLAAEQEREDSDEPTVDTSAKGINTFSCERTAESTNNKINSDSTRNFRPLPKVPFASIDQNIHERTAESTNNKINSDSTQNFRPLPKVPSFASIDQNIPASDHVRLPKFTETCPVVEIPHEESTGISVDNWISNISFPHSPQSSSTSFSDLHWSDVDVNLYETLYTCYSGEPDHKPHEAVEYVNVDFKTSDNSARDQFDVADEPMYFARSTTQSRSTSADGENMASLFPEFQDELLLAESYSHSSKQSFRSSLEKYTNSELFDYKIHSRVLNSELKSYSLNESSKPLISSSSETSTLPEDNETHSRPLFYLPSNSSLDSVSILELSFDESLDLNNSYLQDQNIMDEPNSHLVSSDLSDNFTTVDIRSSSDSESVSSTEFLPCSYCRSVTSLISDSIISYEILE